MTETGIATKYLNDVFAKQVDDNGTIARNPLKGVLCIEVSAHADGAIGSHTAAVADCYEDFKAPALRIADRCGIALP